MVISLEMPPFKFKSFTLSPGDELIAAGYMAVDILVFREIKHGL